MILYIIKFFVSLDLKLKLLINYIKNHWFFLDFVYTENRILKELGVAAVETIEMDEEIEIKGNKINVLEKELKNVNHYDEQKIQTLLNKNPVIRNNNKERAKQRLLNTLSLTL